MANKTHNKRLAQLETAIQPAPLGVVWFGDEKRVKVGSDVMTLKQFNAKYPNGILIRVIREDKAKTSSQFL